MFALPKHFDALNHIFVGSYLLLLAKLIGFKYLVSIQFKYSLKILKFA